MTSSDTLNIPTGPGFERFSKGNVCPSNLYHNFFDGMFTMFDESNFFTNILQFALVALMYFNIGRGRYWKILFYASMAGVFGTLIEKGTVAYICREGDIENPRFHLYSLLVAEIFWIVKEYAIPFLNLTKMKAFSNGKHSKILKITIITLFFAFVAARFYIGYERAINGVLSNKQVVYGHMVAFTIMAIADLICTFGIIYYVNTHNKQECMKANDITHYIKRSSYIILVCVDIVSVILAVLNGLSQNFGDVIPISFTRPFHNIKCSFILILACDALLFKYGVTSCSVRSTNNYKYGDTYFNNNNAIIKSGNFGSHNDTTTNNKSQNDTSSTIPQFNYSTTDYNSSNKYKYNSEIYKSKSIIKNYTSNIKPSPQSTFFDISSADSEKAYPSQSFGFLYQTKNYE